MVIDYIRVIELSEEGRQVPAALLAFAYECRKLAHFAMARGLTVADARAAFGEAYKAGARGDVFVQARQIILESFAAKDS